MMLAACSMLKMTIFATFEGKTMHWCIYLPGGIGIRIYDKRVFALEVQVVRPLRLSHLSRKNAST